MKQIEFDHHNLLRQLRITKGISQEKLAHQIGITTTSYQNIELRNTKPNIYTALKLCRILNIDPYLLFNIDQNKIQDDY